MRKALRLFATLFVLPLVFDLREAGGATEPAENAPTVVHVARFGAADAATTASESHLIAQELFLTALAATQKFTFAADPANPKVELHLRGRVFREGETWSLTIEARRGSGEPDVFQLPWDTSLEKLADQAAQRVAGLHKRSGYVLKREADRIVIARGREDGITVGQRYKTTDSGETFEVISVAPHTAEGRILSAEALVASASVPPAGGAVTAGPASGGLAGDRAQIGAVDIVFVLDTTGSMQDEIDGVVANAIRFSRALESKKIDARLGLVLFKEGLDKVEPLTGDPEEFRSWLAPVRADGAGDETPFLALKTAQTLTFRPNAKRIFVLITDEPAYDAVLAAGGWTNGLMNTMPGCGTVKNVTHAQAFEHGDASAVMAELRRTKAVVFAVTLRDAEGIYPFLAETTGGAFYDLSRNPDFTQVLGSVSKRIEGMFIEL